MVAFGWEKPTDWCPATCVTTLWRPLSQDLTTENCCSDLTGGQTEEKVGCPNFCSSHPQLQHTYQMLLPILIWPYISLHAGYKRRPGKAVESYFCQLAAISTWWDQPSFSAEHLRASRDTAAAPGSPHAGAVQFSWMWQTWSQIAAKERQSLLDRVS